MKIYCNYKPSIKIKVRDILNERGMTQKELAKLTGIRESTIAEALDIRDISRLIDFD